MELPRSLAPWSRYLAIFPRETSLVIGPLIQRISLAIGPMKSHTSSVAGDPDGFDDLARRGSYERLVNSEWLLADEMPDEFTRRAAMGEHVFLRLARREPSGSRVSLALFDAGPNQIGSPRIAQLAALIVLARRAEAARSNFGWGILQKPQMSVLTEVSQSKVLLLMAARDSKETSDEDIRRWRSRCDSWNDLDDLWLVGGTRLAALPSASGVPVLIVRDLIEPEKRELSVVARHVARESKAVVLDLPTDADCARLIRDPFRVASAPPHEVAGTYAAPSNLLFDFRGAKLFTRSLSGRVIKFPIPNSPRASTGSPKVTYTVRNQWISAVGRIGRSTALLTRVGRMARLEVAGSSSQQHAGREYHNVHRTIDYTVDEKPGESPNRSLHPLFQIPTITTGSLELVTVDDHHSLFRLGQIKRKASDSVGNPKMWLAGTNVLSLSRASFGAVFVGQSVPGRKWGIGFIGRHVTMRELPFQGLPAKAHFGYGGNLTHQTYGFVAIQEDESQEWFVVTQSGDIRFGAVDNLKVVGAALNAAHTEPGIICLQNDNRTLVMVNSRLHERPLFTAPADIMDLTVGATAPLIAYSTINGEVTVYSLAHRADLCRFHPGEER